MSLPTTFPAYEVLLNDTTHSHLSPTLIPSNLHLTSRPTPSPSPGTTLVRLRAAALNFRDLLVLASSPLYTPTTPHLIPCVDGAGEVARPGPTSPWRAGDRVILTSNPGWLAGGDAGQYDPSLTPGAGDVDGTLAQYALVRDDMLVRAPGNLGWEEAAALVGAGGTAINALGSPGVRVGEGTTVLAQGTGGVSCFVIQFAAAMGARVIATSSSDEKLKIAKRLGATDTINYRTTPAWADAALALTGGRGVDLVVDVAGSTTIEASLAAVRRGGTVALVGFMAGGKEADLTAGLLWGAKTVRGILGNSREQVERMVELVEERDLHPPVEVYGWGEAGRAFERLREGVVGKVVVRVE